MFFFVCKTCIPIFMSFQKATTLTVHQVFEIDLKYFLKFDHSGNKSSFPWVHHCS